MSEIKPCPFCGSDMIEIEWVNKTACFVECVECEARTGEIEGGEEAIDLWNQRPYDFDMPAIVKKVQRMEAAINQAITDCIPLLSWISDDDTAVEMVEHLSEVLDGALCKQPE